MLRRLAMMLWTWSEPGEYYAYCFWLIRRVEAEHYGERERLREALHKIGYEPIGDAVSNDHDVLNEITDIARAALEPRESKVP